ncbi:MAG TPA: hypothetical protein VLH39_03625, partial [Magnetospirillaceae bacterium]|nr:hypothetical protein [Magnetospirillaceae bacterium]
VQAGVPVRWVIRAGPNAVNGCNSPLVVPSLGIQKTLEVGENVIDFTPGAPGTVPYSCWMGMIRSRFTVVADISTFGPASGTQSPLVVPAIPDPAGTPAPGCPDC